MEVVSDYIDVLIQAPLAVILVVHIYHTHKLLINSNNRLIDTIQSLSKIIKQQERSE